MAASTSPHLQPLLEQAAQDTPGARQRLADALALDLDPVLRQGAPSQQVEAVRSLVAGLRARASHAAVPVVLLAAADAVRQAIAAQPSLPNAGHDTARLPQTALELLAAGALDQLEHTRRVIDAVERDDEAAAQVACLRFYAGLDLQEIGLVLGISSNNVRRAWNRVRARLRAGD